MKKFLMGFAAGLALWLIGELVQGAHPDDDINSVQTDSSDIVDTLDTLDVDSGIGDIT